MGLSPGEFLAVNAAIVTLVVGSFVFVRRRPRSPVALNMKIGRKRGKDVINFSRTEYRPRPRPVRLAGDTDHVIDDSVKDLNILFNWNGHTWDAYEVLDIPAGSSRVDVQKAFELLKIEVDEESLPFVTAAYHAIIKRI